MKPALFLDRDGVINLDHGYVHTPEAVEFIGGIFQLNRVARAAGYLVIVVTNQAGIGRGYYTEEQFVKLMTWMDQEFRKRGGGIDAVYFCPNHPEHGIGSYKKASPFRKPAPGMLLKAADDYGVDLGRSVLVGDSLSDIEAGEAAGVGQLFHFGGGSRYGVASLTEVVAWIGPTCKPNDANTRNMRYFLCKN